MNHDGTVEQWGIFELTLNGPSDGNPFCDVRLGARFRQDDTTVDVSGFYDGDGLYRLRFSPETTGFWQYVTHSSHAELDGQRGTLTVTAATGDNHGPVRVRNTFHFAYTDGTPYRQIGTTCYAWTHQGAEREAQTLQTLADGPFNKIRFCVFPKWYAFNREEPPLYPFVGEAPHTWDFTRFNPAFFRHLETRITDLRDRNIEADMILFHPYDDGHWGFDRMLPTVDDRYLRYVVSRFAAFRNVWWSLANEYDFMEKKRETDWDRFLEIVAQTDPYRRLCSIHNGTLLYNHTHPLLSHASIQNGSATEDAGRAILYRDVYRKPIVFDEVKYEGDIPQRWGGLTAREMVRAFWEGTIAGTYVGHGETYLRPDEVLWWSKGGVLHGESPSRLAFLRSVLESSPPEGIEPIDKWQNARTGGKPGDYYLIYFGAEQPTFWEFALYRDGLEDGMAFEVEIIDTGTARSRRSPAFSRPENETTTISRMWQSAASNCRAARIWPCVSAAPPFPRMHRRQCKMVSFSRAGLACAAVFLLPVAGIPRVYSAPVPWSQVLRQDPAWYATPEAARIADTVLAYQHASGGWGKNLDMTRPPSAEEAKHIALSAKGGSQGDHGATIDNGATFTQLQFLALVNQAAPAPRRAAAVVKGIDYLIGFQYPNGGWQQFYPPRPGGYWTHITYNDGAMIGVLSLLRDVARGQGAVCVCRFNAS